MSERSLDKELQENKTWMYTTSGGWGLEKLKELWALLNYIHEEEQPDIDQEEENELVVDLEETEDLDKTEE